MNVRLGGTAVTKDSTLHQPADQDLSSGPEESAPTLLEGSHAPAEWASQWKANSASVQIQNNYCFLRSVLMLQTRMSA